MQTIGTSRIQLDAGQQAALEKLFSSTEYLLLVSVIRSKCIEAQVESMNASLYGADNDKAKFDAEAFTKKAITLNAILDVLDDLDKKKEEWATIKITTGH